MTVSLAFISDVHGDVHALQDALRLIDEVRVSLIVCLGDVLDYGVFPEETIALLAERGILTLRGNHDRWAIGNQSMGTNASDLAPAARRHLKATVPSWASTVEGVRIAAHHARPGDDMRGVMPDAGADELREVLTAADADVVVLGHTHRPMELRLEDRMVVNPGALLRDPADGWDRDLPTPGTFGLLELPERRWTVLTAKTGHPAAVARAAW